MKAQSILFVLLGFCLLIFLGCEAPENATFGPGNPDPNPTGLSAATITSVDPSEGFLKDVITIKGSGFNTTPAFNLVQFIVITEERIYTLALSKEEGDTRVEIHHCRDLEYKEYLKGREQQILALLAKIKGKAG